MSNCLAPISARILDFSLHCETQTLYLQSRTPDGKIYEFSVDLKPIFMGCDGTGEYVDTRLDNPTVYTNGDGKPVLKFDVINAYNGSIVGIEEVEVNLGSVPVGGSINQHLVKQSGIDYDVAWENDDPPEHGDLVGLGDDDHPQYINNARGDLRYSLLLHDHDADYAALSHTHDYAPAVHDHDGRYSQLTHDHDADYASAVHNHDGRYSLIAHNHDGEYAVISHNHDGEYAAIDHTMSDHSDVANVVPGDGQRLTWDETILAWVPKQSTSGLGVIQLRYKWEPPVNPVPNNKLMSRTAIIETNPGVPEEQATLYFNKLGDGGVDLSLFFGEMQEGQWINIHSKNDVSNYEAYDVTGPAVQNGDIWEVPVKVYELGGSRFSNGEKLEVFWRTISPDNRLPVGGTTGQHLAKTSDADFDTEWVDAPTDPVAWGGQWVNKEYPPTTMVTDGPWLMINNTRTTDRAGPVDQGDPYALYTGTPATFVPTARTFTSGIRVTADADQGHWLESYDVYTIVGNNYRVYAINDSGAFIELVDFVSTVTGWVTFKLTPLIILGGQRYTIVSVVSEPDPAPVLWSSTWTYAKPQNPSGGPYDGWAEQADKQSETLNIGYFNDALQDKQAEIKALVIGDVITVPSGHSWSIQHVTHHANHASFIVAPPTLAPDDEVSLLFEFETVASTPLTVMRDSAFWDTNQPEGVSVLGVSSVDGGNLTQDYNAYGINVTIQLASISPDWDPLSYSG